MGVRILNGEYDGTRQAAVLVNSLDDCAFGPLFDDWDAAHEFTEWFGSPEQRATAHELGMGAYPDARHYSDKQLCELQTAWHEQRAQPQEEVLF